MPASMGGEGGGASSSPASYSSAADVEGGDGGGGGSEPLTAEETHAVLSEQPTGAEPSESEMGDRKDAQSSADNLLPTDKLENGLKHVSVSFTIITVILVRVRGECVCVASAVNYARVCGLWAEP